MELDASDMEAFARDLESMGRRVDEQARPVVSKGALKIKNAMQTDMQRSRHFKAARWITYDIETTANAATAEIGPVKAGAGNLAHIAYFGGANGGGATVRDPQAALDDERPHFERALARLFEEIW